MAEWHTVLSSSLSENHCDSNTPKILSNFANHRHAWKFVIARDIIVIQWYMFLEKIHPPKHMYHPPTHKKNQETLKLSISGMTYRTWQLSVVKSWWITWLLPTSANVPRRLDACVTVAVPVGPRWKATWHRHPVRGFQQVTYHQHPVMSLNRFGVGWRSGLNKILFWFVHFWKGTLTSEKKTRREGERRRCKTYPKGLRTIFTHISLWDKISFKCLKQKKTHQDISHSSCMNPSTIRFHSERLRSQESPGLRSSIRLGMLCQHSKVGQSRAQ